MLETIFNYFIKILFGYLMADFLMGIYHWVKDTYFSPLTPIIGKTFIWGSRLHHIKPRYVIEFSDLKLFINSSIWTLLWMGPLFIFTKIGTFTLTLFLFISLNDVIHKYAHMMDNERPKWITFLQSIYILQSYEEHHIHHISPHDVNYCPITPYVNVILEQINFWKNLEYYIEYYIGYKPRNKVDKYIEDSNYPANIQFIE